MSLFCFTAAPGSISLSLVKGCTFGTFCVQDKKGGDFMLNFTAMIQESIQLFTNFIFIPALLILYLKFRPRKPWNKRTRNLYRLCIALISVYVIRIFCAGFIFYTSKLLTFCRQRFLSAYQGTVLFLDFLPFCAFSPNLGVVSMPILWEFITCFLTIYV